MADKQYTLEELKLKLTEKEKNFCHEYVVDWNGARAARAAGYSENSCRQIATENLSKLYIKQYIEFIKNDYEMLCGISKTKQIKELQKLAYSNIAHIHDSWIDLADWEEIKRENPDILNAVESIDTKTEYRTYKTDGDNESEVEVKYIKVKFYNKISAIQELNKMLGYLAPEKINHSGEINTIQLTKEDREKRISELKNKLNDK